MCECVSVCLSKFRGQTRGEKRGTERKSKGFREGRERVGSGEESRIIRDRGIWEKSIYKGFAGSVVRYSKFIEDTMSWSFQYKYYRGNKIGRDKQSMT